ncbi:sigma factor regulator N-terminal domain-containing protein [Lacticaseibacillus jixianensis]|uniref:Sigma factor regulator N-terminal domain-containing protein n=1 Tax=Lacticaseibacillus jixianensis TaxID=2486012 RepID=A0ABW4BBG6_9LACO|nr:sigma factor regulator N-terminal domain-containing protein [Lacticaseibacillus jixianensis]
MLDNALRRAKWRQRLMMAATAAIVVVIMVPLGYGLLNKLAARQSSALVAQLNAYHTVAEPNVSLSSEMLANNTSFGGNVVTKEYKDIDGYMVPWGTFSSSYTNLHWWMDDSFTVQTVAGDQQKPFKRQDFQPGTLQKIARFYTGTKGLPNEARTLAQLPNHVGEIAVTFKRGYTYPELKEMLPKNLNLRWAYLFNDTAHAAVAGDVDQPKIAEAPIGMALSDGQTPPSQVKWWRKALKLHWTGAKANQAYQYAMKTPADRLKFKGVILTGTTEHLAKVATAEYVAGTSVGVTVPRVPYITPRK